MAELRVVCCSKPAGESPARVNAGAPGSRPPAAVKRPLVEALRQKPLRREQDSGSQYRANPAASTDIQSRSRGAQLTAEVTSAARKSREESAEDLRRIRGAAPSQGTLGKERCLSARLELGHGVPHKPKAKLTAAQRESEEGILPSMVTQQNAAGEKDSWGGRRGGEGKREGMANKPGPRLKSSDGLNQRSTIRRWSNPGGNFISRLPSNHPPKDLDP